MKHPYSCRLAGLLVATLVTCLAGSETVRAGALDGTRAGTRHAVGGAVSGLHGMVVLQTARLTPLAIGTNGPFSFAGALPQGAAYVVSVLSQPAGQYCTVANAVGTVAADAHTVQVTCVDLPATHAAGTLFTVGGTVSGLNGSLTLTSALLGTLTLSANGAFAFGATQPKGAAYTVTVQRAPSSQTCVLANGTGTVGATNVTSLQVTCTSVASYTLGGTVTGLNGQLTLANASSLVTVSSSGAFQFGAPLPSGSAYQVTVSQQPALQVCSVANGTGSIGATNVSAVSVSCATTPTYRVGGAISGLTGTVTLQGGSLGTVTTTANGNFTFPNAAATGAAYAVTVSAQPTGQTCTVSGGSGTMGSANVSAVAVRCAATVVPTYTVGGSVSGLTGTLVLGSSTLGQRTISVNGAYTLPTAVPAGTAYAVTITSQPNGQSCTVASGSGSVAGNVTGVNVTCTPTYAVGGTVSGLSGTLIVQGGALGTATITANGTFKLPIAAPAGSSYSVTILTQPSGQACSVSGGSGTASAPVSSVAVTCSTIYTVGGTVSGATGAVRVTGSGALGTVSVANNGTFQFAAGLPGGTAYSVAVSAVPGGQNCAVANGSGVVGSANVSTIAVTCTALKYTVSGAVQGLTGGGTLVLADNVSDRLIVAANGGVQFVSPISYGGTYSVTVATQPAGQSCSVSNGNGTQIANNIGNVLVTCAAASGTLAWSWNAGSSLANAPGSYGTRGSAAAANTPGARLNGSPWTDASGNLWLFGGNGYDASGNESELNDLWKFTPASGLWTWIGGSTSGNVPGTYGTLGQAGAANQPGGRDSAAAWTDSQGNLWLFGGSGLDWTTTDANSGSGALLNDLWKFNPVSGQWTWAGGASHGGVAGTYGTLGVAAAANVPGARFGASTWTDAAGRLWLFGGYGLDAAGRAGDLNDLWSYNPASGQWTWVAGANAAGAAGSYQSAGALAPGARFAASAWTDAGGNLWLFGGAGYDSAGNMDNLNDLWKYSPAAGQWTWVGGAATVDAPGRYGTLGTAATTNGPGARFGASARRDAGGNLWLVGGYGTDGQGNSGELNDVWTYSPTSGQWTWVAGSSVVNGSGQYGTRNTPSTTATPGARDAMTTWTDGAGQLWLLGGSGIDGSGSLGVLNDLWQMTGR